MRARGSRKGPGRSPRGTGSQSEEDGKGRRNWAARLQTRCLIADPSSLFTWSDLHLASFWCLDVSVRAQLNPYSYSPRRRLTCSLLGLVRSGGSSFCPVRPPHHCANDKRHLAEPCLGNELWPSARHAIPLAMANVGLRSTRLPACLAFPAVLSLN